MQTFDIAPNLLELEKDYQILDELHESAASRLYLARHTRLNRDVAITVMAGVGVDGARILARYEADTVRLKTLRHPNVIPVIECRRLGDDHIAVVRARVRGSSLEQLVTALGPIPRERVAGILDQVRSALEWARTNGIADRRVTQDGMIFQQGSGRVLLSFDIEAGAGDQPDRPTDDPNADARTIGALGWEMLSGRRLDGADVKPLATLRPDLSRAIIAETDALVHCWSGGPARDTAPYIALLGLTEAAPPVGRRPTPVLRVATIDPVPLPVAPKPIAPKPVAPALVAPRPVAAAPVIATPAAPVAPAPRSSDKFARVPAQRPRQNVGLMPKTSAWPIHARIAAALSIAVTVTVMSVLYRHRMQAALAQRAAIEAAADSASAPMASRTPDAPNHATVPVANPARPTRTAKKHTS